MGKDERRYATVVLDANVVIAVLIREQGFNHYIVSLAPILNSSYYSENLRSKIQGRTCGRDSPEGWEGLYSGGIVEKPLVRVETYMALPSRHIDPRREGTCHYRPAGILCSSDATKIEQEELRVTP